MENKRILVLNGPNLGFLGKRQPEIYGSESMDDLPALLARVLGERASLVQLFAHQANGEGQLIDRLELAWQEGMDGLVLNAGAYTHTSLALSDCLAWIKIPCVEVHLSNIWARTDEPLRQRSQIGRQCLGVIAGFGLASYALGVQALLDHFDRSNA